jgi:hypothetical protein
MYRPVSPHSNRGDTVKRSDLIAIEGDKGFFVLVEEGGNLASSAVAMAHLRPSAIRRQSAALKNATSRRSRYGLAHSGRSCRLGRVAREVSLSKAKTPGQVSPAMAYRRFLFLSQKRSPVTFDFFAEPPLASATVVFAGPPLLRPS